MGKPLKKAKARLKARQTRFDNTRGKDKGYKRPGSLNRHKGS